MKPKGISNWDLTVKLLNDNEMKLQIQRFMHGANLYLIFKNIPEEKFYLPSISDEPKTLKEYVNKMPVYVFRAFYEEVSNTIKRIKDTDKWYEKLVKEYKKEAKMTKEELITELKTIKDNNSDIEQGHGEADQLLLEYINDEDIASAFNDIEKWYA